MLDEDVPEQLQIKISDDIVLDCEYETEVRKGMRLYNVANYKEIVSDRRKREELLAWLVRMSARYEERERVARPRQSAPVKQVKGEFNEMEWLT